MSATKMCLVGGPCKHGNWCSDVYCQEHCRFVKEIEQLDALAELCDEAKGGWDLPPAAVSRLGALARKARAAIAAQQPQAEAVPNRAFLERTLAAMEGVIDVADRKTDEFEAMRSCIVDLTLMLYANKATKKGSAT